MDISERPLHNGKIVNAIPYAIADDIAIDNEDKSEKDLELEVISSEQIKPSPGEDEVVSADGNIYEHSLWKWPSGTSWFTQVGRKLFMPLTNKLFLLIVCIYVNMLL